MMSFQLHTASWQAPCLALRSAGRDLMLVDIDGALVIDLLPGALLYPLRP